MIHTEKLTRNVRRQEGDGRGRQGDRHRRRRRRTGRVPRTERGGQVDHPADADHAAAADLGLGEGRRARASPSDPAASARGSGTSARATAPATVPGARRAGGAGPLLRHELRRRGTRGPRSWPRSSTWRACEAAPGQHAVGRSEAPAGRRAGPDAHARRCCSSTSRRPGWTRRTGPICGSTSPGCGPSTNTTIVLTTHYLEEADAQAERVLVIDHGEIIADDTATGAEGSAGRRPDLGRGRAERRSTSAGAAAGGRWRGAGPTRPAGPEVVVSRPVRAGTRTLPALLRRARRRTGSRCLRRTSACRRSTTSSSA